MKQSFPSSATQSDRKHTEEILDHQTALTRLIQALKEGKAVADISQIQAVGTVWSTVASGFPLP